MARTSKQIGRRIEHKQHRAAVRQALSGGPVHQSPNDKWNHRPEQVPLIDDRMPAKGRRGGCKKSPNGKHTAVYNESRRTRTYGSGDYKYTVFVGPQSVCMYCGKHRHGYRGGQWNEPKIPPAPQPMPYTVVTETRGTVAGYRSHGLALADAEQRNKLAIDLGIETRYHVVNESD
jgi:hypothetical protein